MGTLIIQKEVAEETFLTMAFLECTVPARYNTLWSILRNNSLTGKNHYPRTLTDLFNLLSHYRPLVMYTIPRDGGVNKWGKNVQFIQVKGNYQHREAIVGTEWNTRSDVTRYNFQRPGHIRLFCPNGANIQTFQVTLNHSDVLICVSWVLIDFGYTVRSIFNAELVDNIRDVNVTTTVHTNGSSKDYTKTASLHFLPLDVHFNSTSLANIISISEVESNYWVNMDTNVKSAFKLQINDHTIVKFLSVGLDCIILTLLSIINTQLMITHFSPPLNTINHILVNVKLKEQIDFETYKENWQAFCTILPKYHYQQ